MSSILLQRCGRSVPFRISSCSSRGCRWKSSAAAGVAWEEPAVQPLLEVQGHLKYPGSDEAATTKYPVELRIEQPSFGGHALLGRNATNKSLIGHTVASHGHSDYYYFAQESNDDKEDRFRTDDRWHKRATAQVSFTSHQQLLEEGGTASKAISEGGNLTKAAQFLVVRFGLYDLLHRDVRTLSTGEIRKVLLIRALSNRPRLLILDNAFDGLDVASRDVLKDLVSKTLTGFRQDILVQAVSSKATAHTQVLLLTHRAEEIVDEIATLSFTDSKGRLVTESRGDQTGLQMLQTALELPPGEDGMELRWDDPSLPSETDVKEWWSQNRSSPPADEPVVRADNLSIVKGENVTLLHDLDWTVNAGERWLIAGGNGAGKSTLSRMLAKPEDVGEALQVLPSVPNLANLEVDDHIRSGVGWVSTERHMQSATMEQLTKDLINEKSSSPEIAQKVADWLGVGGPEIMNRPFSHLSQGQQKLVLIAGALAERPPLLVLDEPCQGLDLINRQRLLTVVERICKSTDMSLVYITHHFEELLPSVSHVLHLKDRRAAYNGPLEGYDPKAY